MGFLHRVYMWADDPEEAPIEHFDVISGEKLLPGELQERLEDGMILWLRTDGKDQDDPESDFGWYEMLEEIPAEWWMAKTGLHVARRIPTDLPEVTDHLTVSRYSAYNQTREDEPPVETGPRPPRKPRAEVRQEVAIASLVRLRWAGWDQSRRLAVVGSLLSIRFEAFADLIRWMKERVDDVNTEEEALALIVEEEVAERGSAWNRMHEKRTWEAEYPDRAKERRKRR